MKKVFGAILLIAGLLPVSAQDIKSVFLNIPDKMLFGVDNEGKNALVANPSDTVFVEVLSAFNGNVRRTAISDNFIALRTSSAGTLQIKLLPLVNNSKIICVVNTVCGKACDSKIRFFDTDWKPLPGSSALFPSLTTDLFINPDTDRTSQDFVNAFAVLDMTPVKVELDANDMSAKVSLDIGNYLSKEDYDKIKPFLIETPRVYNWDMASFK